MSLCWLSEASAEKMEDFISSVTSYFIWRADIARSQHTIIMAGVAQALWYT
jgi:hypothetical protein